MDRLALLKVLRLAVLWFIPLAAVAAMVLAFLHYDHARSNRAVVQANQEKVTQLADALISGELRGLAADVSYLAEGSALRRWFETGSRQDFRRLQLEILTFARHKPQYDQVRLIDLAGNEVVRADHSVGGLSLVPQESLQSKADRPYVEETLKLSRGEVYFSRFDLNTEQGQIEEPYKPMLRAATPVYDAEGQMRGLVVLNYWGEQILARVRVLGTQASSDIWLVDQTGHWMLGPSHEVEWAFMFPERPNLTFGNFFPEAWQRMSESPSGSFTEDGSLFSYTTVLSSSAAGEAPGPGEPPPRKWYVVSRNSAAALPSALTTPFLFGGGVTFVMLAFLSFAAAAYRVRREQNRAEVELLNRRLAHTEKMEALGQLTGGIAHDFNNLLAVILGNAEIIADQCDDPELGAMAEQIVSSAEEGASLTERLLAVGRRQALHPTALNIGDVVQALEATLIGTLGSGNALEISLSEDVRVLADRSQFESAIVSLVLNARSAMPEGGVVRISSEVVRPPRSLADDLAPGRYARVTVSDNGVGMSALIVEQAFDPFFTTKEIGKGAGMGLATVYGFAKQSGGHAVVESWSGHGTAIHLYLPLAEEPAYSPSDETADPSASSGQLVAGGSERVLMVEDEPQLRMQIARELRQLGYSVEEAESGVEALAILESDAKFDILFTDIVMPGGVNGIDLAERARRLKPDLKVLLTTGYANAPASQRATISDPILHKPYKRQHLAKAMREAVERAA